uniref:Sodium channel protein Nach n=2 Tax=Romanomermis culicivorax TaxID=13658 RepID=A0A915KKY9_ROMCU
MSIYDPDEASIMKKFEAYSCQDTAVFPSDRFRSTFNNYYDYLTVYSLMYQDMVLLCWFAGNRVPCTNNDRYFKLALTDLGPCFTFNEIRKTPNESGIFGPLKLNGVGPQQGFKFLMNVHQEEYCTPYNVYNGIGFLFGLKENYAPYDFNCEKGFFKIPARQCLPKFRSLRRPFQSNVTVSGLANFLETRSRNCKLFWIVANVVCILAAFALCCNSIAHYLAYEVKTTMKATYSCKDTAVYPTERFRTTFNNYYEFLAVFTLTYEDMVLLCWFAGDRIPCTNNDRYFNFALTDLGSCFSFNEIRKPPSQSGISDKLEVFHYDEVKNIHRGPLKLSGVGSQHGFKFLMNVHQEEYCTNYNVYDGIGFLFGLKENYAPYDFNCDKGFFKMAVGYDVNVNIKPTKFIRNTEHLRRCTNKPLVDYNGKHPIPYYRGFCLVFELVKLFYHTCHCIIPSYEFYTPYMNRHNFDFGDFPENVTMANDCDKAQKFHSCVSILMQKFWLNKLWQYLPLCPLPCSETVYTITFGMKKLSFNSLEVDKSVDSDIVKQAYYNATPEHFYIWSHQFYSVNVYFCVLLFRNLAERPVMLSMRLKFFFEDYYQECH